jgi:hypothetical protein
VNEIHTPGASASLNFFPVTQDRLLVLQEFESAVEDSVRKPVLWVFPLQSLDQFCPAGISPQQDGKDVAHREFLVEINGRGVLKKLIDVVNFHLFDSVHTPVTTSV